MLAQQRHLQILARLDDAGGARVADLAQLLDVSEETIRRDLGCLARDGRLVRTHGGAVRAPEEKSDLPFDLRQTARHAQKQAIACSAARYIQEGDVIAVDASSTTHALVSILPDFPLTVVTNSLPVGSTLLGRTNIRVICTGGILDARSRSFVGSVAEEALKRFNITKLFLSTKGVDPGRGLSEVTDDQARFKRALLDLAEKSYLLVDYSKLGVRSVVFFAGVDDVDQVITDPAADPRVIEELRQRGVQVEITREADAGALASEFADAAAGASGKPNKTG